MVTELAEPRRQNPKLGVRKVGNEGIDAQKVRERTALAAFGTGKGGEGRTE